MAPRDHFRAHGRVLVHINATLRQEDQLVLPVTIRDLGFGGAGVEIADAAHPSAEQKIPPPFDLAKGIPVVLEVVAPVLWDPLILPGRIVWNAEPGTNGRSFRAGIRFDSLAPATLLSLFDVLTSN